MNFIFYIFIYLNLYFFRIISIYIVSKNIFEIINCINIWNVEEMKYVDISKCLFLVFLVF